jgi:3-dehydroquinate dehydratase/shikimate dehydrogenase
MICIPVMKETTEEALREMPLCFVMADLVELRIDAITNVDLDVLLSSPGGKVVVTNRRAEEGGRFRGSEEERVALLCRAVELKAHFVDIEASTDPLLISAVVTAIKEQGGLTQLIVSHHDFTGTPPIDDLLRIVEKSYRFGAHIAKIATWARSTDDIMAILNLLIIMRRQSRNIIAFCMGEKGKISRVAAPLFGSLLTYAAREKGAESAPGQLTVEEVKEILRIMK